MNKEKINIYKIVTDKIIESLEHNEIPWKQQWNLSSFKNIRGTDYRGINILLLAISSHKHNFHSPYFLTFNQIRNLKGKIKKGSKATKVIFWKFIEKKVINKDTDEVEIEKMPYLRYYNVFNIDQTIDIPEDKLPKPTNGNAKPIEKCEKVIRDYKDSPVIIKGQPAYSPLTDTITIPDIKDFVKEESYYSCLFHEAIHSTGSEKRLNRDGIVRHDNFGSELYSKEELIGALGSSFLCNLAGIENETIENNEAYIKGWLLVLKSDRKMIVSAAGKAQKATDYILGNNKEEENENI